MFRIKRVYDPVESDDGYRVLVDRLWPRGVSKERAALDEWLREVAPSAELRTWFAHDPAKWDEFVRRYEAELADLSAELDRLRTAEAEHGTVTLLYGARDRDHNEALVLARVLSAPAHKTAH